MNRVLGSRTIQPKLTLGPPDDEYEREADRVADQVMRMPETRSRQSVEHSPMLIQRSCNECEEEQRLNQDAHAGLGSESGDSVRIGHGTSLQIGAQRTPVQVRRMCPECEKNAKKRLEKQTQVPFAPAVEEEGFVQAKLQAKQAPSFSTELESYLANSRGAGQPLPGSFSRQVRASFWRRL